MIDCTRFKGKKIAVLGLGKSGLSAVRALQASNIDVVAWDDNKDKHAPDLPLADFNTFDMSTLDMLVLSPGIPHTLPMPHPIVERAKKAGVKIVNDLHLFKESYDNDIIAITGTNGKSTTTALLHHILKGSQIGGNIGTPLMDLKNECKVTVAELSSYQTELTENLSARGTVWLNITPDHIERHGDINGYVQAKSRIFETTKDNGVAVICIDDAYSLEIFEKISAQKNWEVVPVSTKQKLDSGISILEGQVFDHGSLVESMQSADRLKGEHNHQNAACAYAIAKTIYKMSAEDILTRFETFEGLAHRQFHVATIDNVTYINDSKATNAEATEKALKSYKNIYWLVGGISKDGGIDSLKEYMSDVEKIYLYGECALEFEKTVKDWQKPFQICENLEDATQKAYKDVQNSHNNATVLLSPACASFDQYPNFEKRGEHFEKIVSQFL